MKIFFVILFLLIPKIAISQPSWLINSSIGGGIVLQAVDTNLTTFLIAKNLGKEANPIFVPFASNPIASPILKSSIAVGSGFVFLKYRDEHPKLVFIASLLTNSFYSWVVYHNGKIAKGHY